MNHPPSTHILLTGATGYVGGRLLKRLQAMPLRVRCMARRPDYLAARAAPNTELVQGDVLQPETLERAMEGIDVAFYLIHSMHTNGSFVETEAEAARNFGAAARKAGVKRIVYLGGLGRDSEDLSPHLRSRHETGRILREAGVQTLEFRASIIIGSGSLSFEMIRALVQKLPIMTTPSWVRVKAQPIAISDVLDYLVAAIDVPIETSRVIEIGGEDVVSYADLMREYARQRGVRRWIVPVPILTPRLSSLWLGLVTPLYARVGRKLIDSVRHPTLVEDPSARDLFPIRPKGVAAAIGEALRNEDEEMALTRWSDSLAAGNTLRQYGGLRFGNRLVDSRIQKVSVPPPRAFAPIRQIGGKTGWYYANFLWRLRGFLDLLFGGVGLRRGRRDPSDLRVGDVVDCWRVSRYEPDRLVEFSAEMKLPGRAWLQFEVEPGSDGSSIRQTAIFDPLGLPGLLYWYGIFPLHALIFAGMLRGICRQVERAP